MKSKKHSLPSIEKQLNDVKHNLDDNEQEYLLSLQWLAELNMLAYRYSHLNVLADLPNMSLPHLWGVYLWLKGLGG